MLGLIGKKIGMTQVFDANGKLIPVTAIKIEDNIVVSKRTKEKNGYDSVLLGTIEMKEKRASKPYLGQFNNAGCKPKKELKEFRDFDKEVNVGDSLNLEIFGDEIVYVDVTGVSKGKGFQGGMKRYNFGGGRATHGSKFHRDLGGTAMSSTPARTFKGQHMAGHMGNCKVTVQNLRIVKSDNKEGLLLVKGAVPGCVGCTLIVKKSIKK